jgi:hypothetical protein
VADRRGRRRWAHCRRWPSCTPPPGGCRWPRWRPGGLAGCGPPRPRRLAGLGLRHGLDGCRHLVALHQHAPYGGLPAPLAAAAVLLLAGRAGALPGRGCGGLRALAARHGLGRAAVCRAVAAGRTGARPVVHRLSVGGRRLRAGGFAAGRPGTLGGRLRHGCRGGRACGGAGAGLAGAGAGATARAPGRRAGRGRCWCWPLALPREFTRPTGRDERGAAADQRQPGREVRRRTHAADPGLGGPRAGRGPRRPGAGAGDGRAAAARPAGRLGARLLGIAEGAFAVPGQGRAGGCAAGRLERATPIRWSAVGAGRPTATTSGTLCPLANSSRTGFRWFTELDEHPAGRLRARCAQPAVVRCRAASVWRPTSATKTCSAKNWRGAFTDPALAPTVLGQRQQHGLVRRQQCHHPAPEHLAPARAGAAAPADPRHQHRRHGVVDHRGRGAGTAGTAHPRRIARPCARPRGPDALCALGRAPGPVALVGVWAWPAWCGAPRGTPVDSRPSDRPDRCSGRAAGSARPWWHLL